MVSLLDVDIIDYTGGRLVSGAGVRSGVAGRNYIIRPGILPPPRQAGYWDTAPTPGRIITDSD